MASLRFRFRLCATDAANALHETTRRLYLWTVSRASDADPSWRKEADRG
jgi:hypothetical protein